MKKLNKFLVVPICCATLPVCTVMATGCKEKIGQPTKETWNNAFKYFDFSNKNSNCTIDFSFFVYITMGYHKSTMVGSGNLLTQGLQKRLNLSMTELGTKTDEATCWVVRDENTDSLFVGDMNGYVKLEAYYPLVGQNAMFEIISQAIIYVCPQLIDKMFGYNDSNHTATWTLFNTESLKAAINFSLTNDNSRLNDCNAEFTFNSAGTSLSIEAGAQVKFTYDNAVVELPKDAILNYKNLNKTLEEDGKTVLINPQTGHSIRTGLATIANPSLDSYNAFSIVSDEPVVDFSTHHTYIFLDGQLLEKDVDYSYANADKTIIFNTPVKKDQKLQIYWSFVNSAEKSFKFVIENK